MDISTKIICTIGPSVSDLKSILALIDNGMNVARINFSHGNKAWHKKIITLLKKAREMRKIPLAIMLDTKGPEIRIEKVFSNEIKIKKNQKLKIVEKISNKEDEISISPYKVFYEAISKSSKILFNDGYIESKVVAKNKSSITIQVLNNGVLKTNNGVNIPGAKIKLPSMTKKDVEDIRFGIKEDIDIIAASFIRSAEHVLEIKKLLFDLNKPNILVIAKIENKEGLDNFDSILDVADGIMVARGDLGVELDISEVPKIQKMMIRKGCQNYKPVVTATQMLESMINCPRPTRAEASDVANAIYDSTSLVMLSGETAIGQYPNAAVKQMKNIIKTTEKDFDNEAFFKNQNICNEKGGSFSLANAAVQTAYSSKASAFFVYTSSGFTARLIARWRPKIPIIALTTKKKTYHQLSFYWGVVPVYTEKCSNEDQAFNIMSAFAKKNDFASFGDLVIVTAGVPFGRKGSTNLMKLDSIGHIIDRGHKSFGENVSGSIKIIRYSKVKDFLKVKNKIIVIPRCDESYLSLIKAAKGVIMQNTSIDAFSEKNLLSYAKKYKKTILMQAENALTLLKDNEKITIDTKRNLIYFS